MVTASGDAKRFDGAATSQDGPAGGDGQFTDDELNIQLLSVLLSIEEQRERKGFRIFAPGTYYATAADQFRIDAIRADIISTAAAQKHPDYQPQLEHLRIDWAKRSSTPYESAVTGGGLGDFEDWDIPGVMERRAALRASPLVQDVLKHGLQ